MPDPTDWQLIDRYLAGEATPDEVATLHARAKSDPAWAQALDLLHADITAQRTAPRNTDAAWSRLQSRITTEPGNTAPQIGRPAANPHSPLHARAWFRIAAAILVMVGAFTLNAGSTLRWPRTYGAGARDVHLEGEAFFSVTHDSTAPFRVHARNTVAHDLGTRFTVRAYPELTSVEVAVTDGAVSLRHDRASADSAILRAGQLGRLGASGAPTVESNIPLDRWTAWTGGSLVLDGLTLADAIPQLERWYDVTITVTDSALANRRITARFRDETLPQMLDALTLALGARSRQSGRAVTILPGSQ
jgi:transmembrane sensor